MFVFKASLMSYMVFSPRMLENQNCFPLTSCAVARDCAVLFPKVSSALIHPRCLLTVPLLEEWVTDPVLQGPLSGQVFCPSREDPR